jgi:hypothetical protein
MKRLSATAAIVALATSLVLAPPAAAGGAATVSVVGPATAPVAGVPWPLELEVLQHGVTPIDWERVSLVAREPASGLVTAANGRADGKVGRYVAEVVFPEAGDWTLEFGLHELLVIPADVTTVSVVSASSGDVARTATIEAAAPDCA